MVRTQPFPSCALSAIFPPICLLQDFKTAHLLGVSPVDQFWAMLLGSAASVLVSVAAFVLYTSVWEVPGKEFPAPTSRIWLDMAKLVRGQGVWSSVWGPGVHGGGGAGYAGLWWLCEGQPCAEWCCRGRVYRGVWVCA